jgi:hypothetical protein
MDRHLVPVRQEIAQMAGELVAAVAIPFEQTSELQRQIFAGFAFGMIFAVGQLKRLSPPEVHALVICCLTDTFKYSAAQAGAFSADLIQQSSSKDPKNTHKAIIHRGIDGHRQWQTGDTAKLRENVIGVFKLLGASPTPTTAPATKPMDFTIEHVFYIKPPVDRVILVGTINEGRVRVGDSLIVHTAAGPVDVTLDNIETIQQGDLKIASKGQQVGLRLTKIRKDQAAAGDKVTAVGGA